MGKAGEVTAAKVGGEWAAWQPVAGLNPISADVLAETLNGGQAFRWNRLVPADEVACPPGHDDRKAESSSHHSSSAIWQGFWADYVVRIRIGNGSRVEWTTPVKRADVTAPALARYFATDSDFAMLADTLPWRSDPHLARCIAAFPGLRILRQPFGETLLGFLCSATKQIIQIKQMIALLAERHGAPLFAENRGAAKSLGTGRVRAPLAHPQPERPAPNWNRLPTWPELARIPEAELRACLLGFRARYIAETARFLDQNPGWLEETEMLPYAVAKERLCSLPGVGEKVADCVLLFGAGRLEAFPVDVWILKTLARRYGLDGWRTPQLGQFGRVHFGPLAGLAQQYLFAWERAQKKTEQP